MVLAAFFWEIWLSEFTAELIVNNLLKNPHCAERTKANLAIVILTSLGKSKIVSRSIVKCQQEEKIERLPCKHCELFK